MTPKELRGGRYVLLRTLGEGSQGETYEASDLGAPPEPPDLAAKWDRYVRAQGAPARPAAGVARKVAIKCFRVGKARAWKDVELAEREATTLASLDHPRLPRYIEHFEEDGALYLVMEKIDGESLAARRKKKNVASEAEVVRMLEDVGDALRYLHGRAPSIVHRDIKPGNVIRRPDGSYALVDFGAVRDRLKPGGGSTVVGTFGYMPPEQFQGRASPRSDVYGVAATAVAMLTGAEPEDLPHDGLAIDVKRALPDAPRALVAALSAMLVPDPDRRVGSVDEALALLRRPPAKREKKRRERRKKDEAPSREEKRARRAAARAARKERRARRVVPLVPRAIAQLALLLATLVVWVVVGLVASALLSALALVFGDALRRARAACLRAASRASEAMGRAGKWLEGGGPAAKVRVAEEGRVRVAGESDARGVEVEVETETETETEHEREHEREREHGRGRRRL